MAREASALLHNGQLGRKMHLIRPTVARHDFCYYLEHHNHNPNPKLAGCRPLWCLKYIWTILDHPVRKRPRKDHWFFLLGNGWGLGRAIMDGWRLTNANGAQALNQIEKASRSLATQMIGDVQTISSQLSIVKTIRKFL